MPYGRYSTIHEHRWLRNVGKVEKDVFLFSTTASVVCDDASGLRTTSCTAQEPVCFGLLLRRVLSGNYFKCISE